MDPTPSPTDAAPGKLIVLEGIDGAGTTTQLTSAQPERASVDCQRFAGTSHWGA